MPEHSYEEASIPNPTLAAFGVLIGDWTTEGTHPMVPGKTFHGRASFTWLEGGAFLMMKTEIDEPEIPSAVAIIGSDNVFNSYYMLYFDERGISRKIGVSLRDNVWRWWRDAPGFSQRFTGTIVDDGRKIVGKGELSKDGTTWEGDLALTYTRA